MERIKAKYHCTQFQLYAISRLAWRNFIAFIAAFTDFSPAYTAAVGAAKQLAIDAA